MGTEVLSMNIELSRQQFRYLLDLVYIGNWVLNSTRENDRIREYDQVESLIFSQCLSQGMKSLVEQLDGELIPSRAFADGGIHEAIANYEDATFYELLAEDLALRDLGGVPLTRENYERLLERIDVKGEHYGIQGLVCGRPRPQLAGEPAPEAGPPDDDRRLRRHRYGGEVCCHQAALR